MDATAIVGAANQGYDWLQRPLKPENALQKEIGVETEFLDARLSAGVALFNLKRTDVLMFDLAHQQLPFCILNGCYLNAAEIESNGLEFNLQGEVSPGLNLIVTYSNTDIRYGKGFDEFTSGLRLQDVPRELASFWATYDIKAPLLKGLEVGLGMSTRTAALDSTNTLATPGFTLVDAYFYDNGYGGYAVGLKYGPRRAAKLSLRLEL
jgi:iron complex outermembrane receptor protein